MFLKENRRELGWEKGLAHVQQSSLGLEGSIRSCVLCGRCQEGEQDDVFPEVEGCEIPSTSLGIAAKDAGTGEKCCLPTWPMD